jgi:hypothetical protein
MDPFEQIQREEYERRWSNGKPEPAAAGPPSPIESQEGRQITFLELVAWAIIQAEQATKQDWGKFQAELTANRIKHWLPMPWRGATRPEDFERHVLRMSHAYTTNGRYPLRREQP